MGSDMESSLGDLAPIAERTQNYKLERSTRQAKTNAAFWPVLLLPRSCRAGPCAPGARQDDVVKCRVTSNSTLRRTLIWLASFGRFLSHIDDQFEFVFGHRYDG
jgi:hypothetical protein